MASTRRLDMHRSLCLSVSDIAMDDTSILSCPPPLTPPESEDGASIATEDLAVLTALHVMTTERRALENLETLYRSNKTCQHNLARAVATISETLESGGKLVVCGIGKSGKIGHKIVATMNSLAITSLFLHPTEALHGDLGMIRENDAMLMITFSGKTPELLHLLPHLPSSVPLLVMTSALDEHACPLTSTRPNCILLSAPIHESESVSFGLAAPTSSTTVALALGDSLALAVAQTVHKTPGNGPAEVFQTHHPGGAIGMATQHGGLRKV